MRIFFCVAIGEAYHRLPRAEYVVGLSLIGSVFFCRRVFSPRMGLEAGVRFVLEPNYLLLKGRRFLFRGRVLFFRAEHELVQSEQQATERKGYRCTSLAHHIRCRACL